MGITIKAEKVFTESIYNYKMGSIKLIAVFAKIVEGMVSLTVHDEIAWQPIEKLSNLNLAPADIPIAKLLMEEKKNEYL